MAKLPRETTPMGEFLEALVDPEIALVRYALIAGLLASIAFGIVGCYVITRRISYIAAAVSHCVLGGIGLGLYLQTVAGLAWCDPLYGAIAAALLAAVAIGLISLHSRQREDTVISAIWTIGMGVGLLLLYKTPGYNEPMVYLFGNILYLTAHDLWLIAVLDLVIVVLALGLYNKFLAICFDEEFARLRGIRTQLLYIVLLCLTALCVVLMVRVVGIVMVIGLLTLPAAIAGQFTHQLKQMMLVAVLICMVFVAVGLALSFVLDLPTGPVIVSLAALGYLAAALVTRLQSRYNG
jgi:zinc transport system permease protein